MFFDRGVIRNILELLHYKYWYIKVVASQLASTDPHCWWFTVVICTVINSYLVTIFSFMISKENLCWDHKGMTIRSRNNNAALNNHWNIADETLKIWYRSIFLLINASDNLNRFIMQTRFYEVLKFNFQFNFSRPSGHFDDDLMANDKHTQLA